MTSNDELIRLVNERESLRGQIADMSHDDLERVKDIKREIKEYTQPHVDKLAAVEETIVRVAREGKQELMSEVLGDGEEITA